MTTDWTDENRHDPGITMLDLLIYTAETLLAVVIVLRWRSRHPRPCGVVDAYPGAANNSTPH